MRKAALTRALVLLASIGAVLTAGDLIGPH